MEKTTKKTSQTETCKKEEFKQMIKKVSEDATAKIKDLKKKFDKADDETKNKILVGLSVVAAGLVVLAGVKKKKDK